ncbi:MAG TPA: hypothetical protein VH000_10055, partial [Rhizomicrobium sp.]|nr:hypothetical protein [Rhizomicrobium sp.]
LILKMKDGPTTFFMDARKEPIILEGAFQRGGKSIVAKAEKLHVGGAIVQNCSFHNCSTAIRVDGDKVALGVA